VKCRMCSASVTLSQVKCSPFQTARSNRHCTTSCLSMTMSAPHVVPILPAGPRLDRRKEVHMQVLLCSSSRAWWRPANVPELMPGHYPISPPAAGGSHGGCIHWLCGSWKTMAPSHVCTLNIGQEEPVYVDLPPDAKSNKAPSLASSADAEAFCCSSPRAFSCRYGSTKMSLQMPQTTGFFLRRST
jgi:hypothetical protein